MKRYADAVREHDYYVLHSVMHDRSLESSDRVGVDYAHIVRVIDGKSVRQYAHDATTTLSKYLADEVFGSLNENYPPLDAKLAADLRQRVRSGNHLILQ